MAAAWNLALELQAIDQSQAMLAHPKCKKPLAINEPKPCLTELTIKDITDGIEKMLEKWPIKR